jgi:hypothetical protein
MVDKLMRNLFSISFLFSVISNVKNADSPMYNVEKKATFSILICSFGRIRLAEISEINHFET